jgi:hypothetical protein
VRILFLSRSNPSGTSRSRFMGIRIPSADFVKAYHNVQDREESSLLQLRMG